METDTAVTMYKEKPSQETLLAVWESITSNVRYKASTYFSQDTAGSFSQEDVMQEAFMQLPDALNAFDPERGASFVAFFLGYYVPKAFRIAKCGSVTKKPDLCDTAISGDIRVYPDSDHDFSTILDMVPDPNDPIETYNDQLYWLGVGTAVRDRIDCFPPLSRSILRLHLLNGISLKRIQEEYHPEASYSQIATLWKNGQKKLRKQLLNAASLKEYEFDKFVKNSTDSYSYYNGGLRAYENRQFTSNVEAIVLRHEDKARKTIDKAKALRDAEDLIAEIN